MTHPWPVQITALTPAACGAVRWRTAGASWVTVIVKATFQLVHGQAATLTSPRDVEREDRYGENTGGLEVATETAPYLPSAGVLVMGHVYAAGARSAPTAAARIAVARERPLLEKTIHVIGDRSPISGQPEPFLRMPLGYNRAYGGPTCSENPIGVGAAGTTVQPNFVDPTNPQRPAGLGPISRHWGARKHLIGEGDEVGFRAADPEIHEGTDWRYFHAAPPDQQMPFLRGDEWLVLDGLHPSLPRVQTRLPSAIARARWHVASLSANGPAHEVELIADTLVIDTDQQICSMVWRGRFALEPSFIAPLVRVVAGVELGGQPIAWSRTNDGAKTQLGLANTADGSAQLGPSGPSVLPRRSGSSLAQTVDGNFHQLFATAMPFKAPEPGKPSTVAVMRELSPPVITHAPKSLKETSDLDMRVLLAAVVPFKGTGARPSPLAATSGVEDGAFTPALPFQPTDPSRPVLASLAQPIVPRAAASLGGTIDEDTQTVMRAALPFAAPSFAQAPLVDAISSAIPVSSRPQPLPPPAHVDAPARIQPPMIMPAPPLVEPPPMMQVLPAIPPVVATQLPTILEPPPRIGAPPEQRRPANTPVAALAPVAPAEPEPPSPDPSTPREPPDPITLAGTTFPVERCAAIAAAIAWRKDDKAAILRKHELSADVWAALDSHWRGAVASEMQRGNLALLRAHDMAYVAQIESDRGPVVFEEYVRLTIAVDNGIDPDTLRELDLPRGAVLPVQRIWMERVRQDKDLAERVRRTIERATSS